MELDAFEDGIEFTEDVVEESAAPEVEAAQEEKVEEDSESTSPDEDVSEDRTVPLKALTAERSKYKSQIDELRAELEALKQGNPKDPEPEPEDPDLEMVKTLFDGLEKHPTIREMSETLKAFKEQQAGIQRQQQLQASVSSFRANTPDFDEVFTPETVQVLQETGLLAQAEASENPVASAYQMAQRIRSVFAPKPQQVATPKPKPSVPVTSAAVSNGSIGEADDGLLDAFGD